MSRRLLLACVAPVVALPFQVAQAEVLFRAGVVTSSDWPGLLVANAVLLIGAAALAADLPVADRSGRAVLVGIGVPLLLPGPTVIDSLVHAVDPGLPFVLPNLLLLMMLGSAEAGIYLLATRPRPQL